MKDKVDLFYDLFDKAAMLYYQSLGLDYYEAFLKVVDGIINGNIDSRLSDQDTLMLEEIYNEIVTKEFYNEEIRLASELLLIKAFKHLKFPLDLMTPDVVNYLLISLINGLFPDSPIRLLDTALGTGNMLFALHHNFRGEAELIGIEKDERLVKLAQALSELQSSELTIYSQEALKEVYESVEIVVGDLDAYLLEDNLLLDNPLYQKGVRYFPYLLVAARLVNIKPGGYFIYLINNDFFSQPKNEIFKDYLENKANLGLIALPETMFQKGHPGRSILIGKKVEGSSNDILIIEIPSLKKESLKNSLDKIQIMIERISEEKKCIK